MRNDAKRRGGHRIAPTLRALLGLGIAATLLATSACSGRGDSGASTDGDAAGTAGTARTVAQFAIVTPEKESDHGWNQQGLRGARAAAEQLGIALDEHADVGYDNTEAILTQVVENDNDFVIAHASGFSTVGARVAAASGTPILLVDAAETTPGTNASVVTQGQEGAYLAGVAAALRSETGTVGIVASAEDLNWYVMAGGFVQGVRATDPAVRVVMATVGPAAYGDAAGGTAVANQVIAAGADVIFGMGDGATAGYLQAVEQADVGHTVSYIATVGDVSEIVEDPNTVLTTLVWDFTDTFVRAIEDLEAGTFGDEVYELTVANGGLSLSDSDTLTEEIRAAVATASAGIADGSIAVSRETDRAAVQALIDA